MKRQIEWMQTYPMAVVAGALLVAVLAVPAEVEAWRGEHRGKVSEAERDRAHAAIAKMWAETLRGKVGLSEEVARKVEQIHKRYGQDGRALHQRMRRSKRALKMLLKSGSEDEKAFSVAVTRLLDARREMEQQRRRRFDSMRKHLTGKQQARLLMAMHRLRRRIHKRMRSRHHKRMERRARELLDKDTP